MTSGYLSGYYRQEVNDNVNENDEVNYRVKNGKTTTINYCEWKGK